MPHFLSYIRYALAFEEADSKSSLSGDIFRTLSFRDSTAILIEIPVKDVVAAVFNASVLTVVSWDLFGGRHLKSFTGDFVRDDLSNISFLPVSYSFNFRGLGEIKKFQICIDFCIYSDTYGLILAMVVFILGYNYVINQLRRYGR